MTAIAYSAPTAPRLRLTARGRSVVTVLAALPFVVTALLLGINGGGAVATLDAPTESFTWVTVDAGQSLWDLAADVAPDADPREFAAEVEALNQLATPELEPGQRLAIPPRYAD